MTMPAAHAFGSTPVFGEIGTSFDGGKTAATIAPSDGTIPGDYCNQIVADMQAVYGILIRYRGAWSSATAYVVNDLVLSAGVPYICILARSATATAPASDGTHWTALAGASGALLAANNLFDLANAATARTNLGLGTAATHATGDYDAAGAASSAQTAAATDATTKANAAQAAAIAASCLRASNLGDIANAASARTHLGLGTAAVLDVGIGNNNIVQLDGTAKLPALDASNIQGFIGRNMQADGANNGDVLTYDQPGAEWLPKPPSASGLTTGSVTTPDALADNIISPTAITQKGLVIQARPGQTQALVEVTDSDGAIFLQVGNSGATYFAGGVISGGGFSGSGGGLAAESVPNTAVEREPFSVQSGADYTAVAADAHQIVSMGTASTNFIIPTNASVPFPIKTQITVFARGGTGGSTGIAIVATDPMTTTIWSTGASSVAPILRVQFSMATCIKVDTDTWLIVGDIV